LNGMERGRELLPRFLMKKVSTSLSLVRICQ
jgi:hypothetical protein